MVASRPAQARVLAIDDDPGVLAFLRGALGERYQVLTAKSGAAALGILRARPVDVVLLDLVLPDLDGLEVLKRIRAIRPRARAVMITGAPTVHGAVAAIKRGADDYLSKPFTIDELLATVAAAMTARADPAPSGATATPRPGVLVIDPDPGRRACLAVLLRRARSVRSAASVEEALEDRGGDGPAVIALPRSAGRPRGVGLASIRARWPDATVLVATSTVATGDPASTQPRAAGPGVWPIAAEIEAVANALVACGTPSPAWPLLSSGVGAAIRHVSAHFAEPQTVAALAGAAGLSPSHFAHRFTRETGHSVRNFVRGVRAELARDLMAREPELKLVAVARRTGLASAAYLSRVVKAVTGHSPGHWRRAMPPS